MDKKKKSEFSLEKQKSKKEMMKRIEEKKKNEKELADKYRDRATERRLGQNKDYEDQDGLLADYQPLYAPPSTNGNITDQMAERRLQAIENSKFLGGDMTHTHLVKGLDYALLQKIRSELEEQSQSEDPIKEKVAEVVEQKDEVSFSTRIGKAIYNQMLSTPALSINELFLPGRMAYVVALENDEENVSDIPTTLIRSRTDCPSEQSSSKITTNDIVIQKLTQILSYLRQGSRQKKQKKREPSGPLGAREGPLGERKNKLPAKPVDDLDIFGNVGEYNPMAQVDRSKGPLLAPMRPLLGVSVVEPQDMEIDDEGLSSTILTSAPAGPAMPSSWYSNTTGLMDDYSTPNDYSTASDAAAQKFAKTVLQQFAGQAPLPEEPKKVPAGGNRGIDSVPDSYTDCYDLGMMGDDSDEEADFSQMDDGKPRKGTLSRFDFENEDQYNNYMAKKEALPKAAFQFGVKMSDGRKTRRAAGRAGEQDKINREMQQINSMMIKRGNEGSSSGSVAKKPKN